MDRARTEIGAGQPQLRRGRHRRHGHGGKDLSYGGSEDTGGAAFFTGDMLALERSFSKISKELRTQYLITYKSTNERYDGSYRRIDVRLGNGHENLKLRTKRGYKAVIDAVAAPR